MTIRNTLPILFIISSVILAACGGSAQSEKPPEPLTITRATPDPCALDNIAAEVEKIHQFMREFDDESLLASNTPHDQLNPSISSLQRIRREAEDQPVPVCLVTLKQLQLTHMNTVINTLLGFLSGANESTINQNIVLARQQHDEYILEIAGLLGLTVVAPTSSANGQGTLAVEVPTPGGISISVFNPGPNPINLRAEPDLNAQSLGILDVGASTMALGRSTDGTWIQIAVPDQPGFTVWVYSALIQLSGPLETLPITAP